MACVKIIAKHNSQVMARPYTFIKIILGGL